MALISNTGTLTITAAASSSLGVAANNLSSGQWGTWTTTNTFNPDPEGTGDTIFSYAQRAIWDPVNKVIQFWGGAHGAGFTSSNRMQLATYNDTTNSWSPPVGAGGAPLFEHGYYNSAVNRTTGEVYGHLAFGGSDIRVYSQTSRAFTSSFAAPSVSKQYSNPMEWHPSLGLIWGAYWGIYRRSGSSWVQLMADGAMGDQNPVSAYNHKDGCVYMGGGSDVGAGNLRRVNANGTITSVSYPSGWTLGVWDAGSGSSQAMLLGGTATAKMVAISKGGQIREFDEVANSWGSSITTLPSAITSAPNPGGNWIACTVHDYNCIVFFKLASLSQVSATAHIYKR